MAIAHVKDEIGYANGATSIGLGYTGGNSAGSVLCSFVNAYDTATAPTSWTISDTQTNSYVQQLTATGYNAGADKASIWYAANSASGANTVTASNFNTNSFITMVLSEASGLDTTSVLDTSGGQTGSSNSPTTGNVTSSTANTYWISMVVHDSGGNQTITESQTLVREEQDQSTYMPINVQYEIRSSTATQAHTWSFGSSKPYYAGVLVFQDTSGGGAPAGFMTTNKGFWGA